MLFYHHPPFFVCTVKKKSWVVAWFDYILAAGVPLRQGLEGRACPLRSNGARRRGTLQSPVFVLYA